MLGYHRVGQALVRIRRRGGRTQPCEGRQATDIEPERKSTAVTVRRPRRRRGGSRRQCAQCEGIAPRSPSAWPRWDQGQGGRFAARGVRRAAESWTTKITGPATLTPLENTEVPELRRRHLQNIFLEETREVRATCPGGSRRCGPARRHGRAHHSRRGLPHAQGQLAHGLSDRVRRSRLGLRAVRNTWLADQKLRRPYLLPAPPSAARVRRWSTPSRRSAARLARPSRSSRPPITWLRP